MLNIGKKHNAKRTDSAYDNNAFRSLFSNSHIGGGTYIAPHDGRVARGS